MKIELRLFLVYLFAFFLVSCKKDKLKLSDDCVYDSKGVSPPRATFYGTSVYGETLLMQMRFTAGEGDAVEYFWETPDGAVHNTSELKITNFSTQHEGTYYAYVKHGFCKTEKTPVKLKQGVVEPPCTINDNTVRLEGVEGLENHTFTTVSGTVAGTKYQVSGSSGPGQPTIYLELAGTTLIPGVYRLISSSSSSIPKNAAKLTIRKNNLSFYFKSGYIYVAKNGPAYELTVCSEVINKYSLSLPEETYNCTLKLVIK